MRKVVILIIRSMSLVFGIIFILAFSATFLNEKYFIEGGKNYLSQKLEQKVLTLDEKYSLYKESHPSIARILEKTKLDTVIEKNQETLENNIGIMVNKLIEWWAFLWTYTFDDSNFGTIGNDFKEKLINIIASIKNNFLTDLRIFFFTNALWFLCIFSLGIYKKREDLTGNIIYPTIALFLVLLGWSIFYVLWQNWIENIVSNNFLEYVYPIGIILFAVSFIYFYKNPSNGPIDTTNNVSKKSHEEISASGLHAQKSSTLDTIYKVLKIIFFPITLLLWFLEIITDLF